MHERGDDVPGVDADGDERTQHVALQLLQFSAHHRRQLVQRLIASTPGRVSVATARARARRNEAWFIKVP